MPRNDFSEYTRIRDIVQKRIKRAVKAGLAPMVHVPTVKEIKAGIVDYGQAIRELKNYYSGGSQVKTIRQTGLVPSFQSFPTLPEAPKPSEEQKKERRRQQQRDYRRRRKVREAALTPEKARRYEGYLKALETVEKTFRQRGRSTGLNLAGMTPTQAQAFVEYMDYRFSQGDYTQRYVIDEFIQDFSKLLKRGYYSSQSITNDFQRFLENRSELQNRANNMQGLTAGEFSYFWNEFAGE